MPQTSKVEAALPLQAPTPPRLRQMRRRQPNPRTHPLLPVLRPAPPPVLATEMTISGYSLFLLTA